MGDSDNDITILSDDDGEMHNAPDFTNEITNSPNKAQSWDMGLSPRIISAKTLCSSESDSSFSGFNVTGNTSCISNDRRLHDDLEIVEEVNRDMPGKIKLKQPQQQRMHYQEFEIVDVEEVIRDIMPGKIKERQPQQQRMHYRERKMGFQWLKVKTEKGILPPNVDTTQKEFSSDSLVLDGNDKTPLILPVEGESMEKGVESGPDEFNTLKNCNAEDSQLPSPGGKRRSFAAMRPSASFKESKKQKMDDLEILSRSNRPPKSIPSPSPLSKNRIVQDDVQEKRITREMEKKQQELRDAGTTRSSPSAQPKTKSNGCGSPSPDDIDSVGRRSPSPDDIDSVGRRSPSPAVSVNHDEDESNKKKSGAEGKTSAKKSSKLMSLEKNGLVLVTPADDESEASVGHHVDLHPRLKKNLNAMHPTIAGSPSTSAKMLFKPNDHYLEKMEKSLIIWIKDKTKKKETLTTVTVCAKAVEIFKDLVKSSNEGSAKGLKFQASGEWFKKFKKFSLNKKLKVGHSASTDPNPLNDPQDNEIQPSEVLKEEEPKLGKRVSNIISNHDYGRLVWGKAGSSRPWPAVIVCHKDCGEMKPPADKAWLLWFGDYRITKVSLTYIKDFVKNFKSTFSATYHTNYKLAVIECLKEFRVRSGLEELTTKNSYIKWAEGGMTGIKDVPHDKVLLSANINRCLSRIKKMRLRENSSTSDDSFFPTSSSNSIDSCAEERSTWKPKAALLKAVRDGKHDIETLCIACDRVDCEVVAPHQYFHGGTCSACKDELEDLSGFVSDGTCMYCVICGSPGELIVCDDADCEKVFCSGCVELLVSPKAVQMIMDTDPWYCFLCEPHSLETHGLLRPRPNWQEKVASNQPSNQVEEIPEVEDKTPDRSTFPKRPLRVLSLFDGIATGLFVLDKLGLEVEVYYASEIHESAKNVASLNFGSRITDIGDVQTFTDKQISQICPIDLLVGGSPCNDLSFVNPNRKGLFDPTGTGILFFHYFRALKTIQLINKDTGNHLFWLFENVNHMPREFKTHMNMFLQREPCVIDAKYFSPQSRARCFWGNIPDMYKPLPAEIMNQHYPLKKYITKVSNRATLADKVNCITTNSNSLKPVFQMNDHADVPWITEIERIFGFPAHYTDVGNLNIRERQALLGRSWSVRVIEYILKPLTKYFPHNPVRNEEPQEEDSSDVQNNGTEIKKNKPSRRSK